MNQNSESKNFLKNIDQWVFQQIDLFKTSQVNIKFEELLSGLEEGQRKVLNQLSSLLFILLPFIVVIYFYYSNFQQKSEIEQKGKIITFANEYIANRTEIKSKTEQVFSANAITSRSVVDGKIRSITESLNIDATKIRINNFKAEESIPTVVKMDFQLEFSKLTSKEWISMISSLIERDRFNIVSISMNKNRAEDLLYGTIDLVHYGIDREVK